MKKTKKIIAITMNLSMNQRIGTMKFSLKATKKKTEKTVMLFIPSEQHRTSQNAIFKLNNLSAITDYRQ